MGLLDLFRRAVAPAPAPQAIEGAAEPHRRFPVDRERMFDLSAARRLSELFRTPREDRSSEWIEAFYDAAWNASVTVPEPPHLEGPDGLPYYRFSLPRQGEEYDSQSLSNLAGICVGINAGAAFFASPDDPDDSPEWVMSMGTLDSLLRFDTPDGDPIDVEECASPLGAPEPGSDGQVLTATPSADFLTPDLARGLHRYMYKIWGIPDPRVCLLIDGGMRPSRNLVVGRKRSDFASDAEANGSLRYLAWFLPPKRGIMLMPEDWRLGEMTRLTDLMDGPPDKY
jgi:hypothetical protein